MMKFQITPDEALKPAAAVIKYFKKKKMKIKVEQAAWDGAPYRTTIIGEKAGLRILVEAQGVLSYGRSLQDLASWLAANRHYAEFLIATTGDAVIEVGVSHQMKKDGVGLLIVDDDGSIQEHHRPRNPALVITPDPTLSLGPTKAEVLAAVKKFNDVDRKDGLRDMCEVVERLTEELGVTACRKAHLKIPEAPFRSKDWASQINELARQEAYNPSCGIIVSAPLRDDLHSFRGARNLIDHKARSLKEEKLRQKQFAERMMQGPRLVAQLLSLKRRVK
jgi:hypothetical protein